MTTQYEGRHSATILNKSYSINYKLMVTLQKMGINAAYDVFVANMPYRVIKNFMVRHTPFDTFT